MLSFQKFALNDEPFHFKKKKKPKTLYANFLYLCFYYHVYIVNLKAFLLSVLVVCFFSDSLFALCSHAGK